MEKNNIVFICGSLERGCDGVGDYTRRLAGELIRQGHSVSLLALKDYYVIKETHELQEIEGISISVVRLPYQLSSSTRFVSAEKFINAKNPEWISLQYVPYAYHEKGLPFGLSTRLSAIGAGKKWHIMFHELWVGNENFKNSIISFVQRFLIRNLFNQLKPSVVHTQLPIYLHQLKDLGKNPKELPLFSNIPVVRSFAKKKNNQFTIGFFSQAIASEQTILFLKQLEEQLISKEKEIQILFIGGSEKKMKKVGDVIEKEEVFKNRVKYTGYLSQEEISAYLQTCDLGITPLPLYTLGKSGSVAAFLTHQIPIAVPDSNTTYLEFEKPFFTVEINKALLLQPDLSKLSEVKNAAILAHNYSDLKNITQRFLNDLHNSNTYTTK